MPTIPNTLIEILRDLCNCDYIDRIRMMLINWKKILTINAAHIMKIFKKNLFRSRETHQVELF